MRIVAFRALRRQGVDLLATAEKLASDKLLGLFSVVAMVFVVRHL